MKRMAVALLGIVLGAVAAIAAAQSQSPAPAADARVLEEAIPRGDTFVIGAGDVIRVAVFQSPDLTLETRVDAYGAITYPFIGSLAVGGRRPADVERMLAEELERRQILKRPQVTVNVAQFRSQQVSVLGHVNRPGKFPLDLPYTVSDVLALAGGVTPLAADTVVLSRSVNGERVNMEIDLLRVFLPGARGQADPEVIPGDVLYAHRAPTIYIYGEVQRPGAFRLERNMTVRQALSTGGGLTVRGTTRALRITRRTADGGTETVRASLETVLQADDVIRVAESWF